MIYDWSHMKFLKFMDYNRIVKSETSFDDAVRLIRFASILWVGYLILLALINQSFSRPQSTSLLYYGLLGCIAILCLILAYWRWMQQRLKRALVPLIIVIITVMPVIVSNIISRLPPIAPVPLGPRFASPEGSILAIFPFLFVGLLLVAWQYKWQYILVIILGIAVLNMGVIWSFAPMGSFPFRGGLILNLIQTVIFLAVGFSISYLISRLRQQQNSLESANSKLTHYATTLEHLATSQERNRLARELHDTLAHTLSGLSVQLETVKAYWDVDPKTARSTLENSLAATHSGLEETRRAIRALRATPLEDMGLSLAIKTMAEDATTRTNITLDLAITDRLPTLSPDVEQCIYRVAQEAVTNVVVHAKVKELTLKLELIEGKVTLIVHDDGVGFDAEKSANTSRFGLMGIRERAHMIGGELTVISKPDKGTTIKLVV
jgi:signal transduction histidine kinase